MQFLRPTPWLGAVILLSLAGGLATASQVEQLSGVVNSVNLEARKIAVTPTGKDQDVDVTVNDQTVMTTQDGKTIHLKDLKQGDGLGVAHTGGVASKIIVAIKPSELTGHVKSVGANLKTFVVTETGTTVDVTVAVTPETTIVNTAGKKMELKDLKKGDGVGISHVNSVASKVVVNVKPVE